MCPRTHFLQSIVLLLPLLLRNKPQNLQVTITVSGKSKQKRSHIGILDIFETQTMPQSHTDSPSVLRLRDGVGTSLAVVLGHIFTLLEGCSLILQDVSDTESVAI